MKLIKKKIHGSEIATLIISNEEMEDITKIVESLEELGLPVKGISETIRNETKEQKGEFFPILLGALTPSLLARVLSRKGVIRTGENF